MARPPKRTGPDRSRVPLLVSMHEHLTAAQPWDYQLHLEVARTFLDHTVAGLAAIEGLQGLASQLDDAVRLAVDLADQGAAEAMITRACRLAAGVAGQVLDRLPPAVPLTKAELRKWERRRAAVELRIQHSTWKAATEAFNRRFDDNLDAQGVIALYRAWHKESGIPVSATKIPKVPGGRPRKGC
jgi:hypothetical protein